jgi:hypothetical protein
MATQQLESAQYKGGKLSRRRGKQHAAQYNRVLRIARFLH